MEEDIDIIEEDVELDNQAQNKESKEDKTARIQPFQWKKGQSGNPAGRPKGKTMKEYAKELLACQTDEEREAFLHGIDKRTIWEMAEGKAEAKTDITSGGEKITWNEQKTYLNEIIPQTNTGS